MTLPNVTQISDDQVFFQNVIAAAYSRLKKLSECVISFCIYSYL